LHRSDDLPLLRLPEHVVLLATSASVDLGDVDLGIGAGASSFQVACEIALPF
jgi:hypothetical protein